MTENIDYLNRIYALALQRGLCKNKGEFAECLGMSPSTISGAFQGNPKYLTDNFMRRLKVWARQMKVEVVEEPKPEVQRPDIVIPAATMDLYTSMAKSIDRLTALVDRLQAGGSASAPYTQKNFLRDGK